MSLALGLELLQQGRPGRVRVLAEKVDGPHVGLPVHVRLAGEDEDLERAFFLGRLGGAGEH